MLDQLRQSASSWVVKILFGFLVASFAIWGIGDIFRGPGRGTVVAEVGDQAITGNDLITEFQRQLEQLRSRVDENLDAERARDLGLLDTVVGQMVSRAVFDAAADDLGIAISDDIVRAIVTNDPSFQSVGGLFDNLAYEQALRGAGYSKLSYEATLRRDLARTQLASAIQAGAKAPDSLVEALYAQKNERRVMDLVGVPNSSFAVGEPGEAELVAFHAEHADRFTAPEYRSITAVRMEAKDLAKEIAVPEDDIRLAYDSNPDRFKKPGRRNLQQILLDDEAGARRAHDMLRGGKGFAEVAKEVTGQEEADITIGWVTKEALLPDLVDPVFALEEGGVSAPIKSALGWHLLKVTEVEREVERGFDEVRDELRDEIAAERAFEGLFSLANQLEDELAGGARLDEAAARLNLDLATVEAIDRQGYDRQGNKVEGLPGQAFLESAFSTGEGQDSLLTETPEGGYFILRVDKVIPRAVKPLESIRDEVAEAWKEQRRSEAARRRAGEIVDRVRGGDTLQGVAAEMGLEIATTEPSLRSDSRLHPYLALKLFEEPVGAVASAIASDGYVVGQLKRIEAADPKADKEGVEALRQELSRAVASDLLAQYGAALQDRYSVKVNRSAIDALF